LRNICAITMPMNGRSPGSGTCTTSARRISRAITRAYRGRPATTDSLRRASTPTGRGSGTWRSVSGSGMPPERAGTTGVSSVISSNSEAIAVI
jgi:hypothetical protein